LAEQFWFRLVGGAFLIYLAVKIYFATALRPAEVSHRLPQRLRLDALSHTHKPLTILAYIAVYAALGLSRFRSLTPCHRARRRNLFRIGTLVAHFERRVTLFRKRVNVTVMTWINRTAGLLIFLFGLFAWATIFF